MKSITRLLSILLAVMLVTAGFAVPVRAETRYDAAIRACYEGLKARRTAGARLLSDPAFLADAGTTGSDWTAFALARYEAGGEPLIAEDYAAFADALEDKLDARLSEGLTAATKYTDLYRMLLTLGALGREKPDAVRAVTAELPVKLTRLNVVTLSYALLLGGDFRGTYAAADFVAMLLSRRHTDGGWTLNAALSPSSDPDVTAMALAALAGFRGDPTPYPVGDATLTVNEAIEAGLARLSAMQQADGGFISYGTKNAESAAQVILALTTLGLDPETDPRFVKNGRSVADALLSFRLPDGAFTHAFDADPANPGAAAGQYNGMATDQALLALVALRRAGAGQSGVFVLAPPAARLTANEVFRRLIRLLLAVLRLLRY